MRDGFEDLYRAHFAFVYRTVRRLGVPDAAIDDAVQDVFLVVHRRFDEWEWSSSERTLLFGVAVRVAKDHRRALQRRRDNVRDHGMDSIAQPLVDERQRPDQEAERRQAHAIMHRLLDRLDDDKRAILVSVELEQMTVPEVAQAMSLNPNTVYTKLRAARQEFDKALARFNATGVVKGRA